MRRPDSSFSPSGFGVASTIFSASCHLPARIAMPNRSITFTIRGISRPLRCISRTRYSIRWILPASCGGSRGGRSTLGRSPDFGAFARLVELLDRTRVSPAHECPHRIDDAVVIPIAGNGGARVRERIRLQLVLDRLVFRVDDLAEAFRLEGLVEDLAGLFAVSLQECRIGDDAFEKRVGARARRNRPSRVTVRRTSTFPKAVSQKPTSKSQGR